MTSPAPASLHTITLYQNKRIAVGERHTVDLSEFLSSPLRIDCGPSPKDIKSAKETCALWSPGTFANNHRQKKNVESIFALGFDLDEEPVVTFDLACSKLAAVAGHLTTSFRHRTDAPRLRLIALLSRPVNADEYARLWTYYQRRLVGLGMGVGAAAKDPSRGWFVPSSPNLPGHEYRHARLPGTPIDVDQDLALADSYAEDEPEPEHKPRRAAAGILERARLYVETWDPAIEGSGGSNLAFAHIERLVRGFDLTDDDALTVLASWNKRCKPPWSKKELLHKIRQGRERGDTNWGDLRDVVPIREGITIATGAGEAEETKLIYDRGQPAKIAGNVVRMLKGFPRGTPSYNEFTDKVTWPDGKPIEDTDSVDVQDWLMSQPDSTRVRVSVESIHLALVRYAKDHIYHPVRTYLRGLQWDKEPRVERLFIRGCGAPDIPYTREAAKCFMIGAVARIMDPGCKLDSMPVLEGPIGLFKSTVPRILAGKEWFGDSLIVPGEKDGYQNLVGKWIYEWPELASLRSAKEIERVTAYLSSPSDYYRKSYGRRAEDVPRQSVFFGTTNDTNYMPSKDSGLFRRLHPIVCTVIDKSLLIDNRDQLWAEAVAMYDAGNKWWLPNAVKDAHAELAEERHAPDPWIERIAMLERKEHTMGDVLAACGVDAGKRTVFDEKRLSPLLRKAGWTPHRVKRNGVTIRFWVPPLEG